MNNYVLVFALNPKGQVPVVSKNKPDYLKDVMNLPGGKIEEGEMPDGAALRELREETGLAVISYPRYLGTIFGSKSIIYVFRADVVGELQPAEGETEVVSWQDCKELYINPKLMPNLRLILPLCISGAIGWSIYDETGDWRGLHHTVQLELGMGFRLEVKFPGMAYYNGNNHV